MTPPAWQRQADASERAPLGSLLPMAAMIEEVAPFLRVDHFRADAHGAVYAAVLALWDRRAPVDAVAVADELERRGRIGDVGYDFLGQLTDAEPTGFKALYYAGLVRDNARRHALLDASLRCAALAESPGDSVDGAVERAERLIMAVAEDRAAETTCAAPELVAG